MDVVVDGHLMMRQEKYREASLFFIVILTLSEVECRRTPVFLFSPLLFLNPSHPCKIRGKPSHPIPQDQSGE
jgi:hypothetical protein